MDLGIAGRVALVMASSQGLGLACAKALAREGVRVTINGRNRAPLDAAADGIEAAYGARPTTVIGDISTDEGRRALLAACPAPDILVTNNAGPQPGKIADWDHDALVAALEMNMLGPALVIRAVLPAMQERRFGRIVNITSAMVKSPRAHQGLSAAARTGLTALCKSLVPTVAADNVTINNLLPERIDTGRAASMVDRAAKIENISVDAARAKAIQSIAAKRFGLPEEFADCCAFLCSAQAGYISGQNIQLDGGSYAGLL